jgi:hypothetical protein
LAFMYLTNPNAANALTKTRPRIADPKDPVFHIEQNLERKVIIDF